MNYMHRAIASAAPVDVEKRAMEAFNEWYARGLRLHEMLAVLAEHGLAIVEKPADGV
jgi:hypothetical protein